MNITSSCPGFSLTLNLAEGLPGRGEMPKFYTNDVQSLRTLITESKRLKEASGVHPLTSSVIHFTMPDPPIIRS